MPGASGSVLNIPFSCFSVIPLRARPTLFPYTTLFRSARLVALESNDLAIDDEPVGALVRERVDDLRDRKSTRLNSSHRCISYAVFCLKKKKAYTPHNADGTYTGTLTIQPALRLPIKVP